MVSDEEAKRVEVEVQLASIQTFVEIVSKLEALPCTSGGLLRKVIDRINERKLAFSNTQDVLQNYEGLVNETNTSVTIKPIEWNWTIVFLRRSNVTLHNVLEGLVKASDELADYLGCNCVPQLRCGPDEVYGRARLKYLVSVERDAGSFGTATRWKVRNLEAAQKRFQLQEKARLLVIAEKSFRLRHIEFIFHSLIVSFVSHG